MFNDRILGDLQEFKINSETDHSCNYWRHSSQQEREPTRSSIENFGKALETCQVESYRVIHLNKNACINNHIMFNQVVHAIRIRNFLIF